MIVVNRLLRVEGSDQQVLVLRSFVVGYVFISYTTGKKDAMFVGCYSSECSFQNNYHCITNENSTIIELKLLA